jgi:competence protein ComEA
MPKPFGSSYPQFVFRVAADCALFPTAKGACMKKLVLILAAILAFGVNAFAAVDVNKATQAELEAVKGIGPAKAKAIINHRTKNGPFKSAEDLDKVKGIGKGTLSKIAPEITLDGKPLSIPAVGVSDKGKKAADKPAAAAPAPAAAAQTKAPDVKEVKPEDKPTKKTRKKKEDAKD